MKLDRNLNPDGKGKYALINLRTNKIEFGRIDTEDEFFVIKLRDRNARAALLAYATEIDARDPEFAAEVVQLAERSGTQSRFCKDPD